MAVSSVSGIGNIRYDPYSGFFERYGNSAVVSRSGAQFPVINNSTEKFKGNVTGYHPTPKTAGPSSGYTPGQSGLYLNTVKSFGGRLKQAFSASPQNGGLGAFNVTARSSDDSAVSVRVTDQAEARHRNAQVSWRSDASEPKTVNVRRLAESQRNTGVSMQSAALSGARTGVNEFTVQKNGREKTFSVRINATDSVRTAQTKMADAINGGGLGVTATVRTDERTRQSALLLSSNDTGVRNAFVIEDGARGNLVERLGAAHTTQDARDAEFTVNGAERTSSGNTVELGDGITGTLKQAGTGNVQVSLSRDTSGFIAAVRDMAGQFNGLLSAAQNRTGDRGADTLTRRLNNAVTSSAASLSRIGITRDRDGLLEVDEERLRTAFEDGTAERALDSDSAGFASRVSQVARQAETDPEQFLDYWSSGAFTPSTAEDLSGYETEYFRFMSSIQNQQWANAGLLLSTGA